MHSFDGVALLVEDDPFIREAVANYLADLGFAVQAAATFADAMQLVNQGSPSFRLAIVDLSLPRLLDDDASPRLPLGLELVAEVKRLSPETGVVVFSAYTHHLPEILDLIKGGQRGLAFVPKGSREETLRRAIERCLAGDVYLPANAIGASAPEAVQRFLQALPSDVENSVLDLEARLGALTPRQNEVAERLFWRPQFIAIDLKLEEKTVRNYVDMLYDTLGLKDHNASAQGLRREPRIVLAVLLRRLRSGSASILT